MRKGLIILLCLAGHLDAQDAEPSVEDRAFVLVETPTESTFLGEPFRIRLVVGFDRKFFDEKVVPWFRRAMDFQAKVIAPFFEEIEGAVALGDGAPAGVGAIAAPERPLSFALNDEVVAARRVADREVGGRTFTVLQVERAWRPARAGEIVLPPPVLRFRYATRFRGDFFSGRQPVDPADAEVTGNSLVVRIRALPEAGRPAGFRGAVGRFRVRAEADRDEAAVGESIKVTLLIEGDGDLAGFDPPRLDDLPGFHVYGAIDDRNATPRRVTYDLSLLSASVTEIPGIPFAWFDPAPPGRYVLSRTAPIPLAVRPGPTAEPPPPPPPTREGPATWPIFAAAAGLAAIGLIGYILRRRARERDRLEPDEARARAAADAVGERAGEPGADLATVLSEYLALRLGCAPAAVIGPDLAIRLGRAGVPGGPAAQTAGLIEAAVAARYGGDAAEAGAWAVAVEQVRVLEAHFRADRG